MKSTRLLIVGSTGCGKSAFISKAIFDEFEQVYIPTLTEDSYRKSLVVGMQEHNVDILDVGGTPSNDVHHDRWFSWADSFIFLFGFDDVESFAKIKSLFEKITKVKKEKQGILPYHIPMLLVGTKVDLGNFKVSHETAIKMGAVLGCPFYETSSNHSVPKSTLEGKDRRFLPPSEILAKLILERSKRFLHSVHRDLLKATSSAPSKEFQETKQEENLSIMYRTPSKLQGLSASSLIDELRYKWSKPLNKLPVYIDFPRLAMKVEIVVGAKVPKLVKAEVKVSAAQPKVHSMSLPAPPPTESPANQSPANQSPPQSPTSNHIQVKDKNSSASLPLKKVASEAVDLDKKKKKDKKDEKKDEKKDKKDKKKKKKDDIELTLESRVRVTEKPEWGIGNIRFYGNSKLGSGKWVGLELEKPCGTTNGTVKGVTYFNCPDNQGVMIPAKKFSFEVVWFKKPPSTFAGGVIKNNYGEEWIFDSSTGSLRLKSEANILYEWDGKFLKPGKDAPSFGAGMWNGEIVSWYKKDWMIFKTSKRDETFRYDCKDDSMVFEPAKSGVPRWFFQDGILKSDSVTGEWFPEDASKVPPVLTVLLQLLRYIRIGLDAHKSSSSSPSSSPPSNSTPSTSSQQTPTTQPVQEVVSVGPSQPSPSPATPSPPPQPEKAINPDQDVHSLPPGKRIKVTCQLNNWTFRIPISEHAKISHLLHEISRRSSRRLALLEESLTRRRDEIVQIMNRLDSSVSLDDEAEETATVVRLFVEVIKEQITEINQVAISQVKETELELYGIADRIDELLRPIVQASINILKNPEVDFYRDDLKVSIRDMTDTLDSVFIFQSDIEVIDLITSDFAALEPTDSVLDVEDTTVITILKRSQEDDKTKEEKKKKREMLQKKREQEVREREEAAKKREIEEKEQQRKEEEERERRWNEIFSSLERGEDPTSGLGPSPPAPQPTQNPTNASPSPQPSNNAPVDPSNNKALMIGQVMKEKLLSLSEKLGEVEQTKIIAEKFSQFVKEGTGDTARQLARFLESVLKEDSQLAGVLKAINQSIIATPFIVLKRSFPKNLPFEDVSGTWKIIVNITPNEEVSVIHQKMGISKSNTKEGGYEFHWEMVMRFDWALKNLLKAELEITSITFDSNMSEQNKKELQAVVDNFKS